jgi:hypothetical protein
MARSIGILQFEGSLDILTFYKRKDSDKIIVQKKGGASKEDIKKLPVFAHTRKLNGEFGIRATTSSMLLKLLLPIRPLADYNIAGPLNALLKPIQELDSKRPFGERDVFISRQPKLLEGFSLNKKNPLDTIIRATIVATASKETGKATIEIPALIPGINFIIPPPGHSYYKFQIVAGMLADAQFGLKKQYALNGVHSELTETSWQATSVPTERIQLDLNLPIEKLNGWPGYSIALAIGICFGKPGVTGNIEQVKNAGAGKIVLMC